MKFRHWEILEGTSMEGRKKMVPGLMAARAILQKEGKRYNDKFGEEKEIFEEASEWARRRDACVLADELLRQKIQEIEYAAQGKEVEEC